MSFCFLLHVLLSNPPTVLLFPWIQPLRLWSEGMGNGLNRDDTEGETGLLGDGSVRLVVGEDRLGLL